MPIVRSEESPAFELTGVAVTGLAAPSRGSTESTTYRLELSPGGELPRHRHDHEEIVYVLSGPFVQVLEHEEHELGSGDTVIIPAGTLHHGFTHDRSATLLCAMPAGTIMRREDGSESVPPWGV